LKKKWKSYLRNEWEKIKFNEENDSVIILKFRVNVLRLLIWEVNRVVSSTQTSSTSTSTSNLYSSTILVYKYKYQVLQLWK
jgi:hypothetical protein